jgi:hypothetical protein
MGVLGGGIKLRNPLRPKTKNISPIRIRAMEGRKPVNDLVLCPCMSSVLVISAHIVADSLLRCKSVL